MEKVEFKAWPKIPRENPFTDTQKKPLTSNTFILLLVVTVVALFLIYPQSSTQQVTSDDLATEEKTLAVLAFDNIGGDDTNEYFSLGITEDIIIQLSKIKDLRVIDRSYLRAYERGNKTYKEIGDELNVNNLLLGSVRKIEDKIRISARLINVETEEEQWGESPFM